MTARMGRGDRVSRNPAPPPLTLVRWVCVSDDEQAAYRRVLEHRADSMVRSNPRFWPLAEAFARELLIHDELSGAQVAAIVAELNGEESPDAIPVSA